MCLPEGQIEALDHAAVPYSGGKIWIFPHLSQIADHLLHTSRYIELISLAGSFEFAGSI